MGINKEFFEGLGEVFANIRKEKERPKSIKEILQNLAKEISPYCTEILDPLFVYKNRYKETIFDWKYGLQNDLEQFKEELFKSSWVYDLEDDNTCMGDDDNCPIAEGMKEIERKKLCKKCFEETKERWVNDYKRGIDIAIEYLKAYFKISNIRKEYITITKQKKQINIDNHSKENDKNLKEIEIDLDLLSTSISKVQTGNSYKYIKPKKQTNISNY